MPQNSAPANATETSVRQLIANGKSKTALDNAKAYHKTQGTPASENLLIDAYLARIHALLDQNMTMEAASLQSLVRERFPAANERLKALKTEVAVRTGDLTELLQPLNDPALEPERRAAIERRIQTELTDLQALAECAALPPEHGLRQAAGALHRAFHLVTSGPATDEQIALPEVSHRSPLAPWKVLIRAIASFHRGEDEPCRRFLEAIRPESVPARLIPAMRAMLGEKSVDPLKAAETALIARTRASYTELIAALTGVDKAFDSQASDTRIFKAIREAVRECQRSAPDRVAELRQVIAVRSSVAGLDNERMIAALGGAPRLDAHFLRMSARALEMSEDPLDLLEACELWSEFGEEAVREGWFPAAGPELATLYLHMAALLEGISPLEPGERRKRDESGEWFHIPEKLYERACAMDPKPEAFSRWLRCAEKTSVAQAENVAKEWNRIRPGDFEPLLYLMDQAEKRNAFPKALGFLEKAERIDAVNPVVRAARLRLMVAGVLRQLQQKKPHLAAERSLEIEKLPQTKQGDRPAFMAALRHLTCLLSGDRTGAASAREDANRLLGEVAAGLLVFGIAVITKQEAQVQLTRAKDLPKKERALVPAACARVRALAIDVGIRKYFMPKDYYDETEKQLPAVAGSLDIGQLRQLGEMGITAGYERIAWNVSTEGLKRGGPTEAYFMLLRARALPKEDADRYEVLAAAAAELGRLHRDMSVVDEAVNILRDPFGGDSFSLTLERARDVIRRELKSPDFGPSFYRRPDYRDFMPAPKLGGPFGGPFEDPFDYSADDQDDEDDSEEFDEARMKEIFDRQAPDDMPPEIRKTLFEVMKTAFLTGKSPDQVIDEAMREFGRKAGGGRKKGKRNR